MARAAAALLAAALLSGASAIAVGQAAASGGGRALSADRLAEQYLNPSADPLSFDRGSVSVFQLLRKLHSRASLIMIVAHPDDEDGGMLTYESRGEGVDATLLTLNRGEGGQNVMSSDYWDKLGLVRTEELLAADEYYGVHQYFARVADFGFSKTIDESMKTWGHDRVLYDAVRVVRMTRPLVVTSSFTGNVSDGHGQHQVSGAIAQEVFNAAADPKVFPDQIKAGLLPWAPLKVYARVPFARTSDKGIYDYATGHWAPVRFRNYVDGTFIEGLPSETVSVPEGRYDAMLGRSYFNLGREGLGQQKSQNGGIAVPQFRPVDVSYHLYASRVSVTLPAHEEGFFDGIDTSLAGIAGYAPAADQTAWRERLNKLNAVVEQGIAALDPADPSKVAPFLATGLAQTRTLIADIESSRLDDAAKFNMIHELSVKQGEFNDALQQALGIKVSATVTSIGTGGDASALASSQSVIPGQQVGVNIHIADQGKQSVTVSVARLDSHTGVPWKVDATGEDAAAAGQEPAPAKELVVKAGDAVDRSVIVTVPDDAQLTRPYFDRPTIEQSYYDIRDQRYLNLPTMPYPLSAHVEYGYDGVRAELNGVVQTVHRMSERPPVFEPLLVAPAISLTVTPEAGIVPLSSQTFHLNVAVRSSVKGSAEGSVRLDLPTGWTASPALAAFQTANDGDEQVVSFDVTPMAVQAKPYTIRAVADYKGRKYTEGFEMAGYAGLRPYPYYRPATYRTSGVDVKIARGLRIGYVMGTGDDVASSMEDLGVHPVLLSPADVASGDLSRYDAIVLGIRAYAARAELKTANDRLLDYVKRGGVVIVQYQTGEYDHNYGPYPLTLSGDPEKVVEEDGKVNILAPADPVFSWPNKITSQDFDQWVEERGHGFMRSWDAHYIALTEMHDAEQDAQKGGLLYARYGRGFYVYVAYAFFRQMPEGVPGAFRIFANLISIGKNPGLQAGAAGAAGATH